MDHDDRGDLAAPDALLLAYYDKLAEGRVDARLALGRSELDEGQLSHFRARQQCVHLLERVWPRHAFPYDTLESHSEAVASADELDRMARTGSRHVQPIADANELKRVVTQSGLISKGDLETLLHDLPPDRKPATIEELVYELVQRNVLNRDQALSVASGELSTLVLGDYLILEVIGRGGMGVVYKVLDRRRNLHVALKTLHAVDPVAISRIKHEFRVLTKLVHPNLVVLDQMRCEQGQWFFTMELIEGWHFADYVRHGPEALGAAASATTDSLSSEPLRLRSALQLDRLRKSMGQLATGLHAIHQASKLHQDVKPSNVLVTAEDRVVLVDFGLVRELEAVKAEDPGGRPAGGTRSYMAPEAIGDRELSAASDWYSVGVMLYETLAGRLPFQGDVDQLIEAKRKGPPRLPEDLPAESGDLAELCRVLLNPDPIARPKGTEVVVRLGGELPHATVVPSAPQTESEGFFVGRQAQLIQLDQAFADAQAGCSVKVYVDGPSGIGKTALVHHFLQQLESRHDVLMLRSRCYQRELLPYNALDSIVDAMIGHLASRSDAEVGRLVPDEIGPLVRMFPALGQLRPVREAAFTERMAMEDRELRRMATESLRELLSCLARERPTVLFVDDLQWGDPDSALLLAEIFRPPEPPPLLLVACYRTEDVQDSPCLQILLENSADSKQATDERQIRVGPLASREVEQLAQALSNRYPVTDDEHVAGLLQETKGSPHLVVELARNLAEMAPAGSAAPRLAELGDLRTMLLRRIARLPESSQRLLETIAVAGHPLRIDDACRAAGVETAVRPAVLLCTEYLARMTGTGGLEEAETYHDSVRQSVSRDVPPSQRRAIHSKLADVLEVKPNSEPDVLSLHFEAGGQPEKAGKYALAAGDRAFESLAFDRAADHYRRVLELRRLEHSERSDLRKKLGDALSNAGRCVAASGEYLAAAEHVEGPETVELRRRAAEQLLRAGHVEKGTSVLRSVLSDVGLKYPETARGAMLRILWDRFRLWLRGTSFCERPATEVSAQELLRVDICESAVVLSACDTLRGAVFAIRFILLALRSGEPCRVSYALGVLAAMRAYSSKTERGLLALPHVEQLAHKANDTRALGYAAMVRGNVLAFLGQWRAALHYTDRAERVLRERCVGMHLAISAAQIGAVTSLFFLGELKDLASRVSRMLNEALHGDDAIREFLSRTFFGNTVWLADDDVAEARRQARRLAASLPDEPFLQQHMFQLIGLVQIDLYSDEERAAWERVGKTWKKYSGSYQARGPLYPLVMYHLRARAALASLRSAPNRSQLLRSAKRDAKRIERANRTWSNPLARLIRAGIATTEGNQTQAVGQLQVAIQELDAAEMALFAAAARRRLSELLGGGEGATLLAAGTDFMIHQGVQSPDRMTQMLAPGFD